ncbi:MAG: S-layer homology domain-containing protein [Trueperaceae bacterium]
MKKIVLAVLAAIAFTGAQAQAFPDIPANHWAGEAVQRIADLGIVIGFPDGTYRGNEGFTRYQTALVISRLLDVIQDNMDAELTSLRNALQELASDVAAQDVRLSAVEGAVASISDDTASNTARIEALENGGIGGDVLQDLQNQIAAAQVTADTAAAQSEQNAAAIDALNDLVALLNQDVEDLMGSLGLDDNSDIANIREFVILLRRDQVALRDRVAALEASDTAQTAAIDDLTARVTALEENQFTVSGSIEVTYKAYRLSGTETPFDIDRAWGLNNSRKYADGTSRFSSGTDDLDDDDDVDEDAERAQDRQDIEEEDAGDDGFSTDLTLNVGWTTDRVGSGDPRALNTFESVIKLKMARADNLCEEPENEEGVCADSDGQFEGYVFVVDEFTTTFDPIGAAPLTFQYGEEPSAAFTPYVFDSGGPGFVASVSSPDFLAFLNPTLTIAGGAGGDETYDGDGNIADDYYRGIRGTLSPLQGETLSATGGFSFAQYSLNARENADAAADNEGATVWGLDAQLGISIVDITGEFATQSITEGFNTASEEDDFTDVAAESLYYVNANVDVASLGIPVIKSLRANYRSIPTDDAWFGILADGDDQAFDFDQSGFGVAAEFGLFIVDLAGYFDSYSIADGTSTSAFGVNAKANLFAGFVLNGFFHSVSVGGAAVDDVDSAGTKREDANLEARDAGYKFTDSNYDTGFGVRLDHDGAAENALISGLNLYVGYSQVGADFDTSIIEAGADYTLKVSIVELTPYVSFESETDSETGTDDTTEIKAGTGIKTDELGIIFKPSLAAAVNFRTNSHSDAADYTANELQWAFGVNLGEFLFPNSTLEVRYGSWSGTNVTDRDLADEEPRDADDFASDISVGDENNDITQSVSGYEIHWDYYDLRFTYGAYTDTYDEESAGASAFRIAYKVNF